MRLGANDWPLGYTYDANGHLAKLTYPDSVAVDYVPNALGQPTKAGSYALGVSYYPNGGMSGFTYGNGIVHTMTQNARQLPEHSLDSGGALDDTYDYDPNGNVLAISDGLTTHQGNRDMTYDGLNRLLTTTSPLFAGGTLYTYDVLDNLTRVKAPGRDYLYSYDAQWRLQTVNNTSGGAAVIGLGYDARGNLANKNGQVFQFDSGNRLRDATGLEHYLYDGQGRRVKATHPTLGSIYSFYGQDGALRLQRDERQGKATDYIMLNGSLIARVSNVVSPAVPAVTAPSFVTTGSYTVSWSTVSGATRYELQEHVGSGSWTQVYSGTATSKAFTGKASGVYGYQARACNPSACGAWSAEASISVTLPPSTVPAITLPATALNGNYTVAWTASTGATSYTLKERMADGTPWTDAYTGSALSQAYTNKPAGNYSYEVKGCNDAGCTAYSAIKTVQSVQPPTGAPTLTVPTNSTTGSYSASWTVVAAATSYTLEEKVGSGAWTPFGANATTSQAISGRVTGSYSYRVKGCNGAGCGPVSATKVVSVLLVPSAPTLTVPATNTTGSYTVSWSAPPTSTSYKIQESANGGSWVALYTGTATSKAVSGKGTGSYAYRGQACNASGCSGYSGTKTIAVIRIPDTPSITKSIKTQKYVGTATHIQCSVAWTAELGAATYELKAYGGDLQYSGPLTSVTGGQNTATYCAATQVVRACNSSGCSAWSTPPYPQTLKIVGTPGGGIPP